MRSIPHNHTNHGPILLKAPKQNWVGVCIRPRLAPVVLMPSLPHRESPCDFNRKNTNGPPYSPALFAIYAYREIIYLVTPL
jgi:hypothetical protein